jgi:hypothetical protein
MTNLTPEERQQVYEEERQRLKATRTSWLKFLILLGLVAAVVYGVVKLISIQRQVVQTNARIAEQAEINAQLLKGVINSPPTFTPDLSGQLSRIQAEGNDISALKQNLQGVDPKITYELIKKNVDKYAAQPWSFTGRILEIFERDGQTQARISIDAWGTKPCWVVGNLTTDFVEKNQVTVVGYLAGSYSYTSQAGWNITIPAIAARAIVKPADAARLKK